MRRVDLYAVKVCFSRTDGGIDELPDHVLYLIRVHIIRLNLHISSINFPVISPECKLCDNGDSFCMYDIRQSLILWNERVITQTHHAAKVVVVKGNTGEAGDDGSDTTFCQFFVNRIRFFCDTSVPVCNSFSGGRADKTVFQFYMAHFHGFKYSLHSENLLYKSVMLYYNLAQRKNKKAEYSLPL